VGRLAWHPDRGCRFLDCHRHREDAQEPAPLLHPPRRVQPL